MSSYSKSQRPQYLFKNGLSVNWSTGVGIKHGNDGTHTFGYRDILGQIQTRGVGATDPDWAQIGSSSFSAFKFSLNDVAWVAYHVPHDIVPSSDINFHIHWIPDGTNTSSVKWQTEYMYAKGFNQEAFNVSGTTITVEESPPGTAYQHMTTETADVTISGLTEPDGIIYAKHSRITNGGTDNTDGIFVLTIDVHYQSSNLSTLNKAPTFYGT